MVRGSFFNDAGFNLMRFDPSLHQLPLIQLHCILIPQIKSIADQCMPDGYFHQTGNLLREPGEIIQVEIVTGIDAQLQLLCAFGCGDIRSNGLFFIGRECGGVSLSVQLDAICTGFRSAIDHFNHGINKNRYANAGSLENGDDLPEVIAVLDGVPTVIGGDLPFCIRYKGYLVGLRFEYEVDEFLFAAIPFNIEFGGNDLFDTTHIAVSDMTLIGPGVHRYAICAKELRIDRCFRYVGIVMPPAVAEGGKLIDVYAEFSHAQNYGKTKKEVAPRQLPSWVGINQSVNPL